MARGGRRLGAGAPKGNTNAARHGRYSTREIQGMVEDAMLDPEKKKRLVKFLKGLTGR